MKAFIYIVIFIVVAAVVAGFFIVDSPSETRIKKFDEQRVSDLSFIQSEIINYWTRKGELPKMLLDLKDDIRGVSIPADPESDNEYGYKARGKYEFSLCANFSTNNVDETKPLNKSISPPYKPVLMRQENYSDWWGHSVGYVCFDRKIDPELYPPQKLEP